MLLKELPPHTHLLLSNYSWLQDYDLWNHYVMCGPEAEKLKTFRRADSCMQNFSDIKKCVNSNFATKKVFELIFATKVYNWNIKCEPKKKVRLKLWNAIDPKQLGIESWKCSHYVELMRSTWCELFSVLCFWFRAFQSFRRPRFLFVHPLFILYGFL